MELPTLPQDGAQAHLAAAEVMEPGGSPVQSFYADSVVFITGGSGFLGKQLTEKLLRSCQVSKVYLLLRPKRKDSYQDRIQQLLGDPVFDRLRLEKPEFSEKIIPVHGDVADIRLSIDPVDWEILTKEVEVIFHVAATTKFMEPLEKATYINVRGTREAILLGKSCKNLKSFVHVSSTYAHATLRTVGTKVMEQFYEAKMSPDALISIVENTEPDQLKNITSELINGWHNTYTFTKAISEKLVQNSRSELPICIVRPGIVLSSFREPNAGWVDKNCLYSAIGLIFGFGFGVIKTMHAEKTVKLSFVPCDYVNNAIIVAGKETTKHCKNKNEIEIYSVSSSNRNPITVGRLLNAVLPKEPATVLPSRIFFYAGGISSPNIMIFKILTLFLHVIPAQIADLFCLITGKQRRFVKMVRSINKMFKDMAFFILHDWTFNDDNLLMLFKNLSEQDKQTFNFDIENIDWTEYFVVVSHGIRKYLAKDIPENTEINKRNNKYMTIAHYVFVASYMYCFWKIISVILF